MRTSVLKTMTAIGGAGVLSAGLLAAPSAANASSTPPGCGDPEVDGYELAMEAIAELDPPEGMPDAKWDVVDSGFDECDDLSYSIISVEDGTASSPYQILLFNGTEYVGTASEEAYPFKPEVEAVDSDTLDVTYSYAKDGDANADPTGTTEASFSWDWETEEVLVSGDFPPAP